MRSKVFLLCSLFRRNKAKAKLNQIQTNPSFFCGGERATSTTSRPRIIPATAPVLQKMSECFSSFILIQKMVKAAAVIPQDWIIRLKSRATEGAIPGRELHSCSEMVKGYYSQPAMNEDTAQGT